MCKLHASPVSGNARRSFRLINSSAVVVNGRKTQYALGVGMAADNEGNPETIVALRNGRDMFHVTVARDGSAMCHCNQHFEANGCWHADLAVAIIGRLADTVLEVRGADGQPLCRIESESGLMGSHRRLANLIRSKPHLLANAEQVEALQENIAGTRIHVLALAA
jgi:hypothetical protein